MNHVIFLVILQALNLPLFTIYSPVHKYLFTLTSTLVSANKIIFPINCPRTSFVFQREAIPPSGPMQIPKTEVQVWFCLSLGYQGVAAIYTSERGPLTQPVWGDTGLFGMVLSSPRTYESKLSQVWFLACTQRHVDRARSVPLVGLFVLLNNSPFPEQKWKHDPAWNLMSLSDESTSLLHSEVQPTISQISQAAVNQGPRCFHGTWQAWIQKTDHSATSA